jgi:hypothetical protein
LIQGFPKLINKRQIGDPSHQTGGMGGIISTRMPRVRSRPVRSPVRDSNKLNPHLLLTDMCLRINFKFYWIPIKG